MLDELRLRDLHLVATCLELLANRVQFGAQEGCLLAHVLDLLSAAHDLHLQVQLLRRNGVEPGLQPLELGFLLGQALVIGSLHAGDCLAMLHQHPVKALGSLALGAGHVLAQQCGALLGLLRRALQCLLCGAGL